MSPNSYLMMVWPPCGFLKIQYDLIYFPLIVICNVHYCPGWVIRVCVSVCLSVCAWERERMYLYTHISGSLLWLHGMGVACAWLLVSVSPVCLKEEENPVELMVEHCWLVWKRISTVIVQWHHTKDWCYHMCYLTDHQSLLVTIRAKLHLLSVHINKAN